MASRLEDIRPVVLIPNQRANNTILSGVVDRDTWGYPDEALFILNVGDILSGATSGSVLRIFESDTVSGTASGMTAITSANTSGITLTSSGTSVILGVDLRNAQRFIGATLSVITDSADVGALAGFHRHKQFPPDAVTGVQSRFIGA